MAAIIDLKAPQKIATANALVRLMHLVSPSLPTGGFSYSQGLETAIETGWVTDDASLIKWLGPILSKNMAGIDIPLFSRLYTAAKNKDSESFLFWTHQLIAFRETNELRMEEKNRGRAMAAVLKELGIERVADSTGIKENSWLISVSKSQAAGFALAAADWEIPLADAAAGYAWAWLENQVVSAIKIIPLGQSAGQRILAHLADSIDPVIKTGLDKKDHEIGGSLPALAISSSRHETQYTRLFRS